MSPTRRQLFLLGLVGLVASCRAVPEQFVGEPFAQVRLFFES
ncbi:MAG: hypothetical protein O7B99_10905 [Planctomycetota bacterium]|nr:hypothetical protein [Planctomycetota bacterium]